MSDILITKVAWTIRNSTGGVCMKTWGRVARAVQIETWVSVSWSMVRYSSGDSHYCVVRAPFGFLGFGFVSESGFQLHHKNAFFIVWTRFQKVKLATQHEEFAFPWELWSRVNWSSRAVLVEFCGSVRNNLQMLHFQLSVFWKVHGNTFLKRHGKPKRQHLEWTRSWRWWGRCVTNQLCNFFFETSTSTSSLEFETL